MSTIRPRMHSLLVALGLVAGVTSGALAVGCEGDSGGSSSGSFTAPDSGFDGQMSGSGGPTDDGGPQGDGGPQSDAAIVEPTTPVALVNMPTGAMHGAASADGTAIVITVVGASINYSLYAPATGWTVGAAIPTITTTTFIRGNTAVAMDGKGDAFVAWTTTTPDNHNGFYVVRYDHATSTWGPAQQPDTYAENFADRIAVVANASGDALALGLHQGATLAADVVVQHYAAASGTWTPELVEAWPNGTSLDNPDLHLADNGKAVAIVFPRTIAVRSATGTWTDSPDVSATLFPTRAAINETGDVLVAGDQQNTPYGYRYDGATEKWTTPVQLSSVPTPNSYTGCSAATGIQPNGDGVYVRCFDSNDEAKRTIESYSYTKATNTWSPVTVVDEKGAGPGPLTFAFDRAGDGIAVYQDYATLFNPAPSPAVVNTLSAGVWSPQSAGLGGNINGDYTPTAFLSPNGRGFAVWGEGTALHVEKVR